MAIKYSKNFSRWNRDKVREKQQRRDRALDRRNFMTQLLGGHCRICNGTEELYFEYIGTKKLGKSERMSSLLSCRMELLMAQAPFYKLLCKKDWWKKFDKDRGTKKHGTISMYGNRNSKCRCTPCRNAWNEYSKKWHKKRRDNKRAALLLLKQGKLKVLSNPS